MQNRTRDIVMLVQAADLELVRHFREASRTCAEVRAKNGVQRTFSISCNGKADMRGDQIAMQKMRRFGRENAPPPVLAAALDVTLRLPVFDPPRKGMLEGMAATYTGLHAEEELSKLIPEKAPETIAAPVTRKRTITVKAATTKQTNAPAKPATAPDSAAAQELMPTEFYQLCEWLKEARAVVTRDPSFPDGLEIFPSIEALAGFSSKELGIERIVSEATIREAMRATKTPDPERWSVPLDPHIVLARELAALMKSLGNEPSREFSRLLAGIAA